MVLRYIILIIGYVVIKVVVFWIKIFSVWLFIKIKVYIYLICFEVIVEVSIVYCSCNNVAYFFDFFFLIVNNYRGFYYCS